MRKDGPERYLLFVGNRFIDLVFIFVNQGRRGVATRMFDMGGV